MERVMTEEAFKQEMLRCLRAQLFRYPDMTQEDAVKFVFQAMLGPGHLLSSREEVTRRIAAETAGLTGRPEEPLLEALSPCWCRLSLRRALAEHLPASVIAGLMAVSPPSPPFSRRDVLDVCRELADSGDARITDRKALDILSDETWLPSHSALYRERYRPAYRVISSGWIPSMNAVLRIAGMQAAGNRLLVTLDGPCASGKTTLAGRLAEVFATPVVHMDDFVIPHAQKTAERLAVPGGNCDAGRLVREVIAPWKQGGSVRFRKYDCRLDRLLPEETLPDSGMLILEGSYCNLPDIRKYADVRLFADTPEAVRAARLRDRESPASLQRFYDRWIPLENAYFEAFGLPDRECLPVH